VLIIIIIILTDTKHRAASLQQKSYLFNFYLQFIIVSVRLHHHGHGWSQNFGVFPIAMLILVLGAVFEKLILESKLSVPNFILLASRVS